MNFLELPYILRSFAKTDSLRLCLDQLLQYIHMLMEILKMKILLLLCKFSLVIYTFVHFCLWKCFPIFLTHTILITYLKRTLVFNNFFEMQEGEWNDIEMLPTDA